MENIYLEENKRYCSETDGDNNKSMYQYKNIVWASGKQEIANQCSQNFDSTINEQIGETRWVYFLICKLEKLSPSF